MVNIQITIKFFKFHFSPHEPFSRHWSLSISLKILENLWFSGVFRRYRKTSDMTRGKIVKVIKSKLNTSLKRTKYSSYLTKKR